MRKHCEPRGDASSAIPRAQCWLCEPQCELIREPSAKRHASEHEGVAVPHFKTFMPPVREYLTQYSAVRWECRQDTMGESKGSGPHGGRTQEVVRGTGPLPVTPLGMGRAARDAAECDVAVIPFRLKTKCAPVTAHSDTTALDTLWHSHSETHKRSVADRACVTRVPDTCHVQPWYAKRYATSPTILPGFTPCRVM